MGSLLTTRTIIKKKYGENSAAVYTEISVELENSESSVPESSETESSDPETSEPESTKNGCGSTVDLVGVTAILGVVGAALVVGKKKED